MVAVEQKSQPPRNITINIYLNIDGTKGNTIALLGSSAENSLIQSDLVIKTLKTNANQKMIEFIESIDDIKLERLTYEYKKQITEQNSVDDIKSLIRKFVNYMRSKKIPLAAKLLLDKLIELAL